MENHYARANGLRGLKDNVCIDETYLQDTINSTNIYSQLITSFDQSEEWHEKYLWFFKIILNYLMRIMTFVVRRSKRFFSWIYKRVNSFKLSDRTIRIIKAFRLRM